MPLPYSLLDLSPILTNSTAAHSFRNSRDLAQHAERLGYTRYWLAEHHNISGIASAATSILISHIADHTQKIRVGSGGIMLPNHAPLQIAEQFGTLESLYPGRIDLGIGRAPGGDMFTARALRRGLNSDGDSFPNDLAELMNYFHPSSETAPVKAVPGENLDIPIYLLGSSDFSARLAAKLGLPFAFASHFAPDYLLHALALYRNNFQPSPQLAKPYVMVTLNLFLADTDDQASRLFTTLQQAFLNLTRGRPRQLQPPVDSLDWSPAEQARVEHMTHYSIVGSPTTARDQLTTLINAVTPDELIFTAQIYDHPARIHSFELAAQLMNDLNQTPSPHQSAAPTQF
ncbi:MAG: LLM class flavin-dependent oxidoreductase [Phycisphaerae bacterium]